MKKLIFALMLMVSPLYGQRIHGVDPTTTPTWQPVYRLVDSTKSLQVIEYVDLNSIEVHGRFRQATFRDIFSENKTSGRMIRETRRIQIFDCSDTTSTISMGIEVDSSQNIIQSMSVNVFERLIWTHIKTGSMDISKFSTLCSKR